MTCKELRARARASLDGNIFGSSWLFLLLACLLVSLVNSFLSAIPGLALFVIVFSGCVEVGLCSFTLATVRASERKNDLSLLFNGFTKNTGANILAGLLTVIFTFLWTLLFIIPGIVKAYSYSMTYYILCDHPEYTATEAIKESQRIMRGNKARAFILDLSFIGWQIVGVLCCGIGTLWVTPYIQATKAQLYEEIKYD